MATNSSLTHGLLLMQHRHYQEAEQEIRQVLAQDPENARGHAVLAIALSVQQKGKEALEEAKLAVGLAPDEAYVYHALAIVLYNHDQNEEALAVIYDAVRIDPEVAAYFELMAKIYIAMEKWELALHSARQGLAVDPQDVDCANLEAMALVNLGRRGEATITIEEALHLDPENALTHANLGWIDLHARKYQDALVHFREALRLEPNMEWARRGIVEAMKARNVIYRPILAYFLWMGRLSSQVRWGLIVGLWLLVRLLRAAAQAYPQLGPVLLPVFAVYVILALMTWIANPLFNLFLRLDKFGRYALSAEEITASNWLGVCLFGGLGLLVSGLITNYELLVTAGIGMFAMSFPVAGIFLGLSRKSRIVLAVYALGLAGVGLLAIILRLTGSDGKSLTSVFIFGWVVYTWAANVLMKIE